MAQAGYQQEEDAQLISNDDDNTDDNNNDEDDNRNVVEWANEDYEPERDRDFNSTRYETCWCCDCDLCVIGFAKFWLGCGTTQFGWSVLVWYVINLGADIYSFVSDNSSLLLLVLYTFNLLFVDAPVLYFVWKDQQNKLLFPFAANTAMAFISTIYAIYVLIWHEFAAINVLRTGIWVLCFDGLLYFLTALSLIPLFTYRLKLWNKTDISYSSLYPHSSGIQLQIN